MTDRAELAKELIAFANKIGNHYRLGPVTGDVMDDAANKLRQAAAALSAGEGGAIPKFPTDEMICAGDEAIVRDLNRLESERRETDPTPAELCWAAMVTEMPKEISLSSAPVPAGASEEGLAWLAEVPASGAFLPSYYVGGAKNKVTFSIDVNRAMRFARKKDAEVAITTLNLLGCEPREHARIVPRHLYPTSDPNAVVQEIAARHALVEENARNHVGEAHLHTAHRDRGILLAATADLLKAAKAEERERCAKIADQYANGNSGHGWTAAHNIAAIRSAEEV